MTHVGVRQAPLQGHDALVDEPPGLGHYQGERQLRHRREQQQSGVRLRQGADRQRLELPQVPVRRQVTEHHRVLGPFPKHGHNGLGHAGSFPAGSLGAHQRVARLLGHRSRFTPALQKISLRATRVQEPQVVCVRRTTPMATMELRTVSGPAIKTLLEIIKDLATRINVRFDGDGMHAAFMDHAHVAMTSFSLRPVALQHYKCAKSVTVAVDANSWYRYLKSTAQSDVLTLTLKGDNPDVMGIRVENKEKQYVTTAQMKLTSIDQEEIEVPDIEYSSAVAMGSQDFLRICREMGSLPGMDR